MAIYVDVLILTNYIINMLLLTCHAKLSGRVPRRARLVAAALIGAAGALSVFLPFQGFFASIAYKLALSAVMVAVAAPLAGGKAFLRDWLLFFMVSFLFAGIMLGIWMFLRPQGMLYYNGIVYFDISPMILLVATVMAYAAVSVFWRIVRGGRVKGSGYVMTVRYDGRIAELSAVMDTGNRLYEPFSDSPVIVCRLEALVPLFSRERAEAFERQDYEKALKTGMNLRFVPYKSVGGKGVLPAFRVDEILLEGPDGGARVEKVYLAVSGGDMSCDALLHPDLARVPASVGDMQRV